MREFLRREWENRQIPDEVRLRARDRAWDELQGNRGFGIGWLWAPIPALILLLVWLVWPVEHPDIPKELAHSPLAELPLQAPVRPRIADALPPVRPTLLFQKEPGPLTGEAAVRPTPEAKLPKKLVMNFILPRSGVRMIWIKENTTENTGEEE